MPASGNDPVASALRVGFAAGSKISIDNGLETSAKRVLQTHIGFEPATNYQTSILGSLKSKYIVINTKENLKNGKPTSVTNVNGVNKKVLGAQLPVPKTTLYPPERIQLGYRGGISVGSGMINLGNTCYLNSTLQALFHVPAFVNWLLSEPMHTKCEQNADYHMHPDDITCAVIKTFKCSQQKTGSPIKPLCIYSKLKAICKHLSPGSQEDAHEFMRYLLESLEKGYLNKVQGHNLESWSKETTPVNQIFGGYIRSEVTCLSCRAVSTTFQHFQDLPLDIRKASTLDDALAGYFELERLPDGEDAYKCDKCGRKVAATKKFSVERPPNVLCIQLKRFSMMNSKLTKQVQLPQFLDLKRFISRPVQPGHPVRYRFVSMVTHIGQSANCGHYTAIAQAANGSYYQFDDGCVRQISLGNVMNMLAYLALYELERPFSPHSPRPATTSSAVSHADNESESASVGGSEAKKSVSNGSPTAGSPAPHTSPAPAGGSATSLVPYDSDADSDSETKDSDGTSSGWNVTPADKPRPNASPLPKGTSSWSVTDVTPAVRRVETPVSADMPASSGGEARTSLIVRRESPEIKRRDIVAELTQNSHRGYGFKVRTWNNHTSDMDRQLDIERRENRKRTYDDEYNADFDRGKVKKKRYDHGRDKGNDRYNPFQIRANEQNSWRHKNQGMRHGSRGFRRYNNNNRHYYNNSYYHRNSCYQ